MDDFACWHAWTVLNQRGVNGLYPHDGRENFSAMFDSLTIKKLGCKKQNVVQEKQFGVKSKKLVIWGIMKKL